MKNTKYTGSKKWGEGNNTTGFFVSVIVIQISGWFSPWPRRSQEILSTLSEAWLGVKIAPPARSPDYEPVSYAL